MTRAELRWSMMWALVVMAVTCVPYLYVAASAPPGTSFSGLLYAADDHCVYLSWAQQAAQGHFLLRDLFTGDPQRGIYVSLLSWLVGSVTRFTGVPLILVHHAVRVLFGALLLVLAYSLFAHFTPDRFTRRTAFWFLALSSGLGWLSPSGTPAGPPAPADFWQSEAITFTCLYVNGLFCAALSLMVGIFLLLATAEGKTGFARWGRVLGAGSLGLLLGNIHSYDVITMTGVWLTFLFLRMLMSRVERRGVRVKRQRSRVPHSDLSGSQPLTPDPRPFDTGQALVNALVAAVIALPSVAYQYYLYHVDPVFRNRANDRFQAPPLPCYLLGYGLVAILAVAGAVWVIRTAQARRWALGVGWLPIVWSIVGFVLPYLPFTFQRKLVMGLHLPLAFLAAVGAVALARWVARDTGDDRRPTTDHRRGSARRQIEDSVVGGPSSVVGRRRSFACAAVVTGLLLLTLPSDARFIGRDIVTAKAQRADLNQLPTFIPRADMEAIAWVRAHLPPDGLIFCSTVSGRLIPALAGRSVYVGHWSETPRANERMKEAVAFYRATDATTEDRRAFLADRHIRYVYSGPTERDWGAADFDRDPLFRPIYRNAGAVLYEIQPRTVASHKARFARPDAPKPSGEPNAQRATRDKRASNG
jgi:hypothetical protein